MNPLNFEFTSDYLAELASKVYTNRYFEFVQGEDQLQKVTQENQVAQQLTKNLVLKTKNSESIKLLSAFESDVSPNIGFDQMKRVSISGTNVNGKLMTIPSPGLSEQPDCF